MDDAGPWREGPVPVHRWSYAGPGTAGRIARTSSHRISTRSKLGVKNEAPPPPMASLGSVIQMRRPSIISTAKGSKGSRWRKCRSVCSKGSGSMMLMISQGNAGGNFEATAVRQLRMPKATGAPAASCEGWEGGVGCFLLRGPSSCSGLRRPALLIRGLRHDRPSADEILCDRRGHITSAGKFLTHAEETHRGFFTPKGWHCPALRGEKGWLGRGRGSRGDAPGWTIPPLRGEERRPPDSREELSCRGNIMPAQHQRKSHDRNSHRKTR
jgi:hypothetical protein